jgi:hypothetical protein
MGVGNGGGFWTIAVAQRSWGVGSGAEPPRGPSHQHEPIAAWLDVWGLRQRHRTDGVGWAGRCRRRGHDLVPSERVSERAPGGSSRGDLEAVGGTISRVRKGLYDGRGHLGHALGGHQGDGRAAESPSVIRAPRVPWALATWTATSSAGQEISKSSRMEACEASNKGPTAGSRPARSRATVWRTRSISVTTCLARARIVMSGNRSRVLTRSSKATYRSEDRPAAGPPPRSCRAAAHTARRPGRARRGYP